MPIWGIVALGIGAALGGWLLGTRRIQQEVGQAGLIEIASEWDRYTPEEQDRVAKAMVDSLMDSRSIPALEEGAKFLDAMDRPAQATGLRVEADRLRAKA